MQRQSLLNVSLADDVKKRIGGDAFFRSMFPRHERQNDDVEIPSVRDAVEELHFDDEIPDDFIVFGAEGGRGADGRHGDESFTSFRFSVDVDVVEREDASTEDFVMMRDGISALGKARDFFATQIDVESLGFHAPFEKET